MYNNIVDFFEGLIAIILIVLAIISYILWFPLMGLSICLFIFAPITMYTKIAGITSILMIIYTIVFHYFLNKDRKYDSL